MSVLFYFSSPCVLDFLPVNHVQVYAWDEKAKWRRSVQGEFLTMNFIATNHKYSIIPLLNKQMQ